MTAKMLQSRNAYQKPFPVELDFNDLRCQKKFLFGKINFAKKWESPLEAENGCN
jgi:hypothetical protein